LILEVPDEPLYVDGDPDRLQQIVANLLGNAASYSPDRSRVRLALSMEGGQVVLRIEDRGIGIDPELLPHIFELFVQAEQKLDRPKGGLGIGLTLVKTLVELHGGTVEAHSEGEGKGSSFVVRLPVSDRPTIADPEARPTPTRARNIVLVEDHDDSRELLKALLETKGYSVSEAADGHAALEAIRTSTPDVALVDIGLPGMDGYELARIIRQDPAFKDLVLVALTGYGRDADVKRAKETGFNHHLTKPVGPDVLEGLLSTL
jgi:CheY-like chemotaxis protein/anti-sigma regulatory factor (Ser/Thr protein kinase)